MSNKKISLKDLVNKPISNEEEQKINKRNTKIKKYGIVEYFDGESSYTGYTEEDEKEFTSISSQYKSISEYKKDIFEVVFSTDLDISPDMDKRLVITKEELENAGLLEKYAFV